VNRSLAACALCFLLLFTSCRKASTLGEALGITDKPAESPAAMDVLCDPSAGSTCTVATLRRTVMQALNAAATRPGSVVRLWMQGRDIATTCMVAEVVSPTVKRAGRRAKQHAIQRWTKGAEQTLLTAARPFLAKRYRRSPIAESITRVALAGTPVPMRRLIVVISDGLEVSPGFGDWECGRLPTAKRFIRNLHRAEVLTDGSLRGISVQFCEVDLSPIDHNRCTVSLQRVAAVESLWRTAINAAGAESFDIRHGDTHLQLESKENEK
jgi:hypothetical protein